MSPEDQEIAVELIKAIVAEHEDEDEGLGCKESPCAWCAVAEKFLERNQVKPL